MKSQKLLGKLPAMGGVLGAACVVIALGVYLVTGQFDTQVAIPLGVGLALLFLVASYHPKEIAEILRGRSARYGSNTFAMIVIFLAIVGLANFYSANHSLRWDLTENKAFTLSSQTTEILGKLQGPVKITAFYPAGSAPALEDLLKEYRRVSDKVDYQLVDPDRMPGIAREYNLQRYGTTVIEYQGKRQDIFGFGEQDLTSAILKTIQGTPKKLYFLAGHGEINIESFEGTGGDQAKAALKAENYEVATLNLATAGSVPQDAAVLVIAGAKSQLLDDETRAIKEYLQSGGKAFVMVDPQGSSSVSDILKDWGVEVGTGVVIDPMSSLANQPQVPVVMQYDYSQITKDMVQMTLFPLATSVTAKSSVPRGVSALPLFESTENSWLETDTKTIQFDDGKDARGPLTMALTLQDQDMGSDNAGNPEVQPAAGEDQKRSKMRMVVVGNSIFASNDLMQNPALGNRDLFVNATNWLAEEEGLISIRAKEPTSREILLTGIQESFVLFSSAIFLPFAVLVAGGYVWWRRR
ncbi:MAG: GldG family protein [Chloroflexi bacterium]|nr:GldG family protein [Chloroflexota bacterium]